MAAETAREILRRDFIAVDPGAEPRAVLQLMEMARVRTLPVLDARRFVGWLVFRELARAVVAGDVPVSIAPLVRPGTAVGVDASLAEVARHMIESKQPLVAAAEPGAAGVAGLVTEADLLRAAYLSPSA